MEIDVFGRNPSALEGEFFSANVWSWVPIYLLCSDLCCDLLNDDVLTGMSVNDGSGPDDQATCTTMAEGFELFLENNPSGWKLESELRVTKEGRFISRQELEKNPDLSTEAAFQVDYEDLKKWTEFLRHCGGFAVL